MSPYRECLQRRLKKDSAPVARERRCVVLLNYRKGGRKNFLTYRKPTNQTRKLRSSMRNFPTVEDMKNSPARIGNEAFNLTHEELRDLILGQGAEYKGYNLYLLNYRLRSFGGMLELTKATSANFKSLGYPNPPAIFGKDIEELGAEINNIKDLIAEVEATL